MAVSARLGFRFLGRGAEIYFGRFLPFSLVFIVAELPAIAAFCVDPTRLPGIGGWTHWQQVVEELLFGFSGRTAVVGVGLALQLLGTAVVMLGVLHALDGTPIPLAESARRGLRRAFPLLLTGVLVATLVLYASLLYLAPGLLALTYMSLAVAVCAAEHASPFRSLGRSGDLAGAGLMPLFVVAVATFLVPYALEILLGIVMRDRPLLAFSILLFVRVSSGALGATLIAVAYSELRHIKDGTSAKDLIATFE